MPKTRGLEFGDFQRDLDRALGGDAGRLERWWTDAERGAAGLAVYRNTVAKGAADALAANFPTVERVAGEAWFRGAALRFARARPPARATLIDYGEGFAAWLEAEAAELPYLADLARIDRLWREALFAAEARSLEPQDFGDDLSGRVAVPHPSLRHAAFAWNAPALWRLNQAAETPEAMELDPEPVELMVLRAGSEAELCPLPVGGTRFLDACAAGRTLGEAAAEAIAAGGEVAAILSGLILAGAFVELRSPS